MIGTERTVSQDIFIFNSGWTHGTTPALFEARKVHHPLPLRASTAEAEEPVNSCEWDPERICPCWTCWRHYSEVILVFIPGLYQSARLELLFERK